MKTRMMFYLVSAALLVFAGNSFGTENVVEPKEMKVPPEIETPLKKYDEITGTQGTEGATNTFYGLGAGSSTTGIENSFFGRSAGYNNTEGDNNSFFGYGSGYHNTTVGVWSGRSNSFFGYYSGHDNTIGVRNSFFGTSAGESNTTGNYNSFFGVNAGLSNVSGSGNVFLGTNAGNGYPVDKSNQLFIDNSSSPTPLIWGDFENDNIIIYGGFRAIATSTSSDGAGKRTFDH